MQYDGWLETMLQARFPKHELVFRNLGFSGDEIATRLRSKNFGTPDEWLSGLANADRRLRGEPLRGHEHQGRRHLRVLRLQRVVRRAGRARGVQEGAGRLDRAHARRRNTTADRRRASSLFSPIAHEDLGNPDLPDGKENNQRLELYTKAMAEVAKSQTSTFVDLFTPSREAVRRDQGAADDQGVHLNSDGNRQIAQVIDRALFGELAQVRRSALLTRLRQAVVDKNSTGSTATA